VKKNITYQIIFARQNKKCLFLETLVLNENLNKIIYNPMIKPF